jgi:hypothetical protein
MGKTKQTISFRFSTNCLFVYFDALALSEEKIPLHFSKMNYGKCTQTFSLQFQLRCFR